MVQAACAATSVLPRLPRSVLARCDCRWPSLIPHLAMVKYTELLAERRLPPALRVSGPFDHDNLIHDYTCNCLRWHCATLLVTAGQHLRASTHLHLRLGRGHRGRCWLRTRNLVWPLAARSDLCGHRHFAWDGYWCLCCSRFVLHARAWEVRRLALLSLRRLPADCCKDTWEFTSSCKWDETPPKPQLTPSV